MLHPALRPATAIIALALLLALTLALTLVMAQRNAVASDFSTLKQRYDRNVAGTASGTAPGPAIDGVTTVRPRGPLPSVEAARRSPQQRHQRQVQRHLDRTAASLLQQPAHIVAPRDPGDLLRPLIHPTVYSYQAALDAVLRLAAGDTVRLRPRGATSPLTGILQRLDGAGDAGGARPDGDCRRFRRNIRTPDGPVADVGTACRQRDGSWQVTYGPAND